MGKTKTFSSKGGGEFGSDGATEVNRPPNHKDSVSQASSDVGIEESDPRSTLIMKPGDVAKNTAAAGPAAPAQKRSFGLPSGREQRTMIMAPERVPEELAKAAGLVARGRPASRPPDAAHPAAQSTQPPEIELVEHELPTDVPADSRLVLINEPDSDRAAAFRVLRHHVMECGNPQVIAVSGPTDGCGKTTTAINLAMALSECGRAEVLLVDANMRSPKVASILRFVPPWCFSDQLSQHRDKPFIPWGFVDLKAAGLHIAAVNPQMEHPTRLDAPSFAIAMDRLRLGPYRYIVVDCPSVIGNADVNLIQDASDGVLLAMRTKQNTARELRTAVDQLTPTRILGTALIES